MQATITRFVDGVVYARVRRAMTDTRVDYRDHRGQMVDLSHHKTGDKILVIRRANNPFLIVVGPEAK